MLDSANNADLRPFRHRALLYSSIDEFLAEAVPFVRGGLAEDADVLVVTTATNTGALRRGLGDDAAGVEFVDDTSRYAHPGRMLAAFHETVEGRARSGRAMRALGEQTIRNRTPGELRELGRCEAAANVALSFPGASLMCPYDVRDLPEEVNRMVWRTHSEVVYGGATTHSDRYRDPADLLLEQDRALRLAEPEPPVAVLQGSVALSQIRAFVADQARTAGLSDERIEDAVSAANEVVTNALKHARPGPIRAWRQVDHFVVDVTDRGGGINHSLAAGYLPPHLNSQSARGLWLARQLADLVEVATGPSGTTFRLYLRNN